MLLYKAINGFVAIPMDELEHKSRCTRHCGPDAFIILQSRVDALQMRPGAAAVEEARSGQHIARQLQTDLQFVYHIQVAREAGTGATSAAAVHIGELQPVPVRLQDRALNGDCTAGSPRRHLHGS